MRKSILSTVNKLLLILLAVLGFSCDSDEITRVEYGMPNADFKVNGNIVDEITLANLSNIQIVLKDALSSSYDIDTAYSDADGNYEVSINSYPTNTAFLVEFRDPDGEENGKYLPVDTILDLSDVEFVNGDSPWYSGEKTKELDIKLSPDENL